MRTSSKKTICAFAMATVIVMLPPLIIDLGTSAVRAVLPPSTGRVGAGPTLNGRTACLANPYRESVARPFDSVIEDAQEWLNSGRANAEAVASHSNYSRHDHGRFFPFAEMAPCDDVQCVGGACSDDNSKIVCGMGRLAALDECTVYAIGSHNRWHFEQGLLSRTKCQIHTFDCTGPRRRFVPPRGSEGRIHFHHLCLGANRTEGVGDDSPLCDDRSPMPLCGDTWTLEEIQRHLGHDTVDLLKIDIEGWEWPIFDVDETDASMPMQLLMEVHYVYGWEGRGTEGMIHDRGMSSAADLIRFQASLLGLGYVVAKRDDNPRCPHCTELTLLRVAC